MAARYKVLLVFVVIIGLAAIGWAAFVWAPGYIGGGAPESIAKLNQIGLSGIPDAMVSDSVGKKLNLKALAVGVKDAEILVVHFWASWCGPCVEELPNLIEFSRAHEQIHVFAVAEDSEVQAAVSFYSNFRKPSLNFEVFFDQDLSAAEKFGTEKLPESFLFCRNGKFLQKFGSAMNWTKLDLSSYVHECESTSTR